MNRIRTAQPPIPRTVRTRLLRPLLAAGALGPHAVAHGVHGLVLFLAVVGATFVGDYPAWRILLYSGGVVVLFWVASVYAATISDPRAAGERPRVALIGVRRHVTQALPILEACVPPTAPLLLAVVGWLPVELAYASSVSIGVLELGTLGFLAIRSRGGSVRRSIAAALGTGGIGAAIIAAETFWH